VHLDSFTILIACSAVLVLQGAVFVYFWLRDRAAIWLAWWGFPLIVGGATIVFYAQPGWDSQLVPIAIANLLRILAIGGLWQGVRRFQGRPYAWGVLATVCGGWLVLCLVPALIGNMAVRVVAVSICNGVFCTLAASELRSPAGARLPSGRPLQVIFISFAVVMLARILMTGFAPFPLGVGVADPLWLGIFVMVVFVHVSFAAILFFAMTRERREAEQRSFAMSDPLTGLMNRRAFSDFAERLNRRRTGLRRAMAVLVLDLDHFKTVNDRFGHEVGDRMLQLFANAAEQSIRSTDEVFRMGGEEFCCILPETEAPEAMAIAERIRRTLEATSIETASGPARTTVSVGVVATTYDVPIEVLLAAADTAVYEAKARGRNRIIVADPAMLLRAEPDPVVLSRRRA
jgi:diguanylate cyclase (GGDEF)-like protein